jgi:hypothetical protein
VKRVLIACTSGTGNSTTQEIEPLLRRGADLEVDTSAPLDDVVAAIRRHVE